MFLNLENTIIKELRNQTKGMTEPVSFLLIERYGRHPFILLISCILSLRTKDAVTWAASLRLFQKASTPEEIFSLSPAEIESLIYSVGFYKKKALQIQKIAAILLTTYDGNVPQTKEQLLALPGVGIKTANLVLGLAFNIPALCVDIHVHRIANRLGIITTKTPEETEQELSKLFSKDHWIELNRLLVMLGQNICKPRTPLCFACNLNSVCKKVSVIQKNI